MRYKQILPPSGSYCERCHLSNRTCTLIPSRKCIHSNEWVSVLQCAKRTAISSSIPSKKAFNAIDDTRTCNIKILLVYTQQTGKKGTRTSTAHYQVTLILIQRGQHYKRLSFRKWTVPETHTYSCARSANDVLILPILLRYYTRYTRSSWLMKYFRLLYVQIYGVHL